MSEFCARARKSQMLENHKICQDSYVFGHLRQIYDKFVVFEI